MELDTGPRVARGAVVITTVVGLPWLGTNCRLLPSLNAKACTLKGLPLVDVQSDLRVFTTGRSEREALRVQFVKLAGKLWRTWKTEIKAEEFCFWVDEGKVLHTSGQGWP